MEQLEILLLLRADRDRAWTAEKINDRIRSSLSSVNDRLADLEARGFIRRDGPGFRYDPGPVLEANVDALTAAYIEFRFSVIELIFKKPTDRTQVFAQAFRIRKDDDG